MALDIYPDVNWTAYHFLYGQLAVPERYCAQRQADRWGVPLEVIELPPGLLTSTMTTRSENRAAIDLEPTFVPGRNDLFLSMVASRLYHRGVPLHIVGGWNSADSSGYPDCRSSFIQAKAFSLIKALDCEVTIHSPVILFTKAGVMQEAMDLNIPLELTWSCYTPIHVQGARFVPCGECVSCKLRAKGCKDGNVHDPQMGVNLGG